MTVESQRIRWVNRLQTALKIFVTLGILVLLAYQIHWDQLWQRLQLMPPEIMVSAAGLLLLAQSVCVFRWQSVARPFFQETYRRFWVLYMAGLCLALVLPTAIGGDVGKAYGLGSTPAQKGLAAWTVLVDRYSGLMVQLALAIVGCIGFATARLQQLTGGLLAALALGLYGSWILLPFCLGWLSRRFPQVAPLRAYWQPKLIAQVGGYALIAHGINGGIHVLLGQALGLHLPIGDYLLVYCLASIASVLPVSLGGLGVREGTYVFLLKEVGVDATTATTFAGLWFACLLAVSLAGSPALWSLWHPTTPAADPTLPCPKD